MVNFIGMKFVRTSISLLWLCLLATLAFAQEALDSLAREYERASYADGGKFMKAGPYARALLFADRQEEASTLLARDTRLAKRQRDGKYAAYLYGVRAIHARIMNDSLRAVSHIDSAKRYTQLTSDKSTKGYISYCDGWLLVRNGRETEAVQAFIEGLRQLESTDQYQRIASIYQELYSIYTNWSEPELQKKYAYLNLGLARKIGDPSNLFNAYMTMGGMYEHHFRKKIAETAWRDSAEYYYQEAISTYNQHESQLVVPSDLAHAATNLANLYLEFYPAQLREKVEYYAELAAEIAEKTSQYTLLASAYGIQSDLARKDNNLADAKTYLLAALAAISKEVLPSNEVVSQVFLGLSEAHEAEGDYVEALHYYKQYLSVFKERYDAEKVELAKRLEAQYEKEKQQQEVARLQLEAEKKEQQLHLMDALSEKQQQELQVMKLTAENNQQELAFARLQNLQKEEQLHAIHREVALKSRITRIYIILFIVMLVTAALLLYAYRQRSKTLRQQADLHRLEMEQVNQQHEISNLTAMLNGQERERSRLARDLHDGLGGLLSGTKIELSSVSTMMSDPSIKQRLNKSLGQLDTAVNELRRVAHNLMPELLLKYGLAEAIREYCNRMSYNGLDVSTEIVSYGDELGTNHQIVVYRIIQELVNNAIKHAAATHILVQLAQTDGTIYLTVEDDGKGFDVVTLDGRKSAGIHNVQSRLEYLKGRLHIDSKPGMGTTIEIEFPMVNESTASYDFDFHHG